MAETIKINPKNKCVFIEIPTGETVYIDWSIPTDPTMVELDKAKKVDPFKGRKKKKQVSEERFDDLGPDLTGRDEHDPTL